MYYLRGGSGVGSMGAMGALDPIDKIPWRHGPHGIVQCSVIITLVVYCVIK